MSIKSFISRTFHWNSTITKIVSEISKNTSNEMLRVLCNKEVARELTRLAVNSAEKGITDQKHCKEDIVVSLTSFGKRFYDSYLAVESIMQGTMKPNHIVLWISEEMKNDPIPLTLQNQMKRGLEIKYCRDLRSHTKLLYSLQEFPEACIITVDDDTMYPHDLVEMLVNMHIQYPDYITANVIRPVPEDIEENYKLFSDWEWNHDYKKVYDKYILEGFAGVLYPPHCLNKEIFNESVFMDICKFADDVWFSAMAMLNGTKTIYANPHVGYIRLNENDDDQVIALRNINRFGEGLNDKQIKAVFSKYLNYNFK